MGFTSVHFFEVQGWRNKWWAFTQMRLAHEHLQNIPGMNFYKLMGTGGAAGFSLWPDFSTYVLLANWETEADLRLFENSNDWYSSYTQRAKQLGKMHLRAYAAHGEWNGQNPFSNQNGQKADGLVAVLTRASIKPLKAPLFWRYVPKVNKVIWDSKGLLFAKGIGEIPLFEQATISLWNQAEMMQHFAYRGEEHRKVVQLTRQLKWYSEELFARFEVLAMEGHYGLFDLSALMANCEKN